MTHAHYSVHGVRFDRATRASGIVLMKPFLSQPPPSRSFRTLSLSSLSPRDDAKGKEFPIDGADNGAAKTQTITSARNDIPGEKGKRTRARARSGVRCLQLTAISQKREILHYLQH